MVYIIVSRTYTFPKQKCAYIVRRQQNWGRVNYPFHNFFTEPQ